MVVEENLERLTTRKLKALMRREGIPIPETGTGKGGGVLKKDLILVITDYRARAIGGVEMVIPAPRKTPSPAKTPTAALQRLTVTKLRRKCRELGLAECMDKKQIAKMRKPELVKLIRAAEMGLAIPAPRKTPSPKARTPTPPPAVVEIVKTRIPGKYSSRSLEQLRKMCAIRNIEAEKCQLERDELIAVLMEYDRILAEERKARMKAKKAKPKKKTTPKRKTPTPKKKAYKCGTRADPKCPPSKICDVDTGSCLTRTKAGMGKRAREAREKKYGDEYYLDDEHGLVGRKQDVLDHLEYWGLLPKIPTPKPRTPTPKKTTDSEAQDTHAQEEAYASHGARRRSAPTRKILFSVTKVRSAALPLASASKTLPAIARTGTFSSLMMVELLSARRRPSRSFIPLSEVPSRHPARNRLLPRKPRHRPPNRVSRSAFANFWPRMVKMRRLAVFAMPSRL